MKDRIFGVLQRVGRSFMLPIAVLLSTMAITVFASIP